MAIHLVKFARNWLLKRTFVSVITFQESGLGVFQIEVQFKSSRLGTIYLSCHSAYSGPAHSLHADCNGTVGGAGHEGVLPELPVYITHLAYAG